MKKLGLMAMLAGAFALQGCATSVPVGGILTEIQLPVAVTSNGGASKVGIAQCKSYLALIAQGDCSLEAAKKNGNITQVSHVDWKAKNILGVIGEYELTVYGE